MSKWRSSSIRGTRQGNMAIILPLEPGLIRLHHPGLKPSASLRHIVKYVDESLLESQYGT